MISDTIIFIVGTIAFGIWIVASFLEFKKMEKRPEEYKKRGKVNIFKK